MIRVYYARGEGEHELSISGHAHYADYGQDIVCAGVSAIAFSLLGWLEHNEEELSDLSVSEVEQFYLSCKGSEKIDTAFQMAVIGLVQIAREYPDHVEIEYDRDRR